MKPQRAAGGQDGVGAGANGSSDARIARARARLERRL
jgi:hypothetical protein